MSVTFLLFAGFPSSKKTTNETPLMSAITFSPSVFRKLESAYVPSPGTSVVTSARYPWLLSNPQQLSEEKPMLVPVIDWSAKVTSWLAAGSEEFGGPSQYSRALVTVPETPLSVSEPSPLPRMPPTPAVATSVFGTVMMFDSEEPSWVALAGPADAELRPAISASVDATARPRLLRWNRRPLLELFILAPLRYGRGSLSVGGDGVNPF